MASPYDHPTSEIQEKMVHFLENTVMKELPELAATLKKAVENIQQHATRKMVRVEFTEPPPKSKLPMNLTEKISLSAIDPLELARQLTLVLFSVYEKIEHTEFFGQAWAKAETQAKSSNILKMINYFNGVTNWICVAILSERKVRHRAKIMEMFAKVAQDLKELNNFHALQAVITAFNSSPIGRLKWTKEKLSKRSKQTLYDVEQLMSMQSSYKIYRETLKNCPPPAIPYIGVYLTDLVFIEDGNPDKIANRVNFSKQLYVHNVITTISKFQTLAYNFSPIPAIQQLITQSTATSTMTPENQLYKISLEIEPRGASRQDIL